MTDTVENRRVGTMGSHSVCRGKEAGKWMGASYTGGEANGGEDHGRVKGAALEGAS